ncbi:MAG UNVERIFIED_CONTAM: hypothetical protein LVR18_46395 [Planctomycetaceae bacterium]
MNIEGLAVTVLGLGSFGGGVAAARFLATCGADVTVSDMKTESELSGIFKRAGVLSNWRPGAGRTSGGRCWMVVVSGGESGGATGSSAGSAGSREGVWK